jgi:hypothetical protein
MATTVALPSLITNIVAAFKASAALTGVSIYDGPILDGSYPQQWIAVGHDGSEEGPTQAAQATNTYDQLGAKKMFEDGSINCVLAAWDGNDSPASKRTAAYNLLSAVDTAIRSDPSFGGVVLYSGLGLHTMTYSQDDLGIVCLITFTINYRART